MKLRRAAAGLLVAPMLVAAGAGASAQNVSSLGGNWDIFGEQSGPPSGATYSTSFVAGPGTPTWGPGSLELDAPTSNKVAVGTLQYGAAENDPAIRLDDITELRYWTYTADTTLAPTLQLEVSYPGSKWDSGYGTLTFEPYMQGSGAVAPNTWQEWNVLDGKVWVSAMPTPGEGGQSQPVTWDRFLQMYPNATVLRVLDVSAGSSSAAWGDYTGYVDAVAIGIDGNTTVYDFNQPANTPTSKKDCKKGGWANYEDASYTAFANQGDCVSYVASHGKNKAGHDDHGKHKGHDK